MLGNAQTPAARTINHIQEPGYYRANDEKPGEQNQSREHFLNEIDLKSDERDKSDPQPFASVLLAEHLAYLHQDSPLHSGQLLRCNSLSVRLSSSVSRKSPFFIWYVGRIMRGTAGIGLPGPDL